LNLLFTGALYVNVIRQLGVVCVGLYNLLSKMAVGGGMLVRFYEKNVKNVLSSYNLFCKMPV